jgi:hypothetical protein
LGFWIAKLKNRRQKSGVSIQNDTRDRIQNTKDTLCKLTTADWKTVKVRIKKIRDTNGC